MTVKRSVNNKLTEQELKKVKVEAYVQSLFSRDECRSAVLNASRYLEANGTKGICSDSAVDMLSNIALAFAAGELDWVKDIRREDE